MYKKKKVAKSTKRKAPRSWQSGALRSAGSLVGGMYGFPKTGRRVGAAVSKYLGYGDYNQVDNSIVNSTNSGAFSDYPSKLTASTGKNAVVFEHTEFVQNIVAQNTVPSTSVSPFQNNVGAINPGMSATFPFLSGLAKNFVLYEFEQLVFEYRPLASENSSASSGSSGKVVMCVNYDPSAEPFGASLQMENYDFSVSGRPFDKLVMGVECDRNQRFGDQLYVRSSATLKDKVLTDLGTFQIATEGLPIPYGNNFPSPPITIGELWVTYRVRLMRTQIPTGLGIFDALPFVKNAVRWIIGSAQSTLNFFEPAYETYPAETNGNYIGSTWSTNVTSPSDGLTLTLSRSLPVGKYVGLINFVYSSSLLSTGNYFVGAVTCKTSTNLSRSIDLPAGYLNLYMSGPTVGIPSAGGGNPSNQSGVRFGRLFSFEVQSNDFGVVNQIITTNLGGLIPASGTYSIQVFLQIFPVNTAFFKNTVP